MSSEIEVEAVNWRNVEVGRVVVLPATGKRAVIVTIIDQRRVLIDGPAIERQGISLNRVVLTDIVIPEFPRGARTKTVAKKWQAASVDEEWEQSEWAQKAARRERRRQLTDFERFQVERLRRQRNAEARKIAAKA